MTRARRCRNGATGRSNNRPNNERHEVSTSLLHRARSEIKIAKKQQPLAKIKSCVLPKVRQPPKQSRFRDTDLVTRGLVESICNSLKQRFEGKSSLRKVFLSWDKNHDGVVDRNELEEVFDKMGCLLSKRQAEIVCKYFSEGSGLIPYNRFVDLVFFDEVTETKKPRSTITHLERRLRELGVTDEVIENAGKPYCPKLTVEEILKKMKTKFQAKVSLADEFRRIDDDKNGTICREEFNWLMKRQGLYLTEENLKALFQIFDTSNDGDIEYHEFIDAVFPEEDLGAFIRLTPRYFQEEVVEETPEPIPETKQIETKPLPKAFEKNVGKAIATARVRNKIMAALAKNFDSLADVFSKIDQNNDGRLSYSEFKNAILSTNPDFNEEEADIFLEYVDKDGSGFIDFEEFQSCIDAKHSNKELTRENDFMPPSLALKDAYEHHGTMKTATTSNIGMSHSNKLPKFAQVARVQMKRKIFPAGKEEDKCNDDPEAFRVTQLKNATFIPKRNSFTPTCNTDFLIKPFPTLGNLSGSYTYENGEKGRFMPESSTSFSLMESAAYHKSQGYLKKRDRNLARVELKRSRMKEQLVDKCHLNENRRLKTVMMHQLSYYKRLESNNKKENIRRDLAGI